MALRISYKIYRHLYQNILKLSPNDLQFRSVRNTASKPKYGIYPPRHLKSSSTGHLPRKKSRTSQEKGFQKPADLQPASMPKYVDATLESKPTQECPPEPRVSQKSRIPKSNTQNALTMPLKLPLLADPFPASLKSFPSETISDEEKARLMYEESKMQTRYHLQNQPQVEPSKVERSTYPSNDAKYNRSKTSTTSPPLATPQEGVQAETAKSQPNPRTRSARYLRTSRHVLKNQRRKFSSDSQGNDPITLSETEQCEVILGHLKAQYPEYKYLAKPLLLPGSEEEREFLNTTLKYIAKHRTDLKREPAPFPSYSEVKTFVRAPRSPNNKMPKWYSDETALKEKYTTETAQNSRQYSTTARARSDPEATSKTSPKDENEAGISSAQSSGSTNQYTALKTGPESVKLGLKPSKNCTEQNVILTAAKMNKTGKLTTQPDRITYKSNLNSLKGSQTVNYPSARPTKLSKTISTNLQPDHTIATMKTLSKTGLNTTRHPKNAESVPEEHKSSSELPENITETESGPKDFVASSRVTKCFKSTQADKTRQKSVNITGVYPGTAAKGSGELVQELQQPLHKETCLKRELNTAEVNPQNDTCQKGLNLSKITEKDISTPSVLKIAPRAISKPGSFKTESGEPLRNILKYKQNTFNSQEPVASKLTQGAFCNSSAYKIEPFVFGADKFNLKDTRFDYKEPNIVSENISSSRLVSSTRKSNSRSYSSFSINSKDKPKNGKPECNKLNSKNSKNKQNNGKQECKTLKSPGCADPNPTKCENIYEESKCKKQAAPYPSYSECMGDMLEEDLSECKLCPWQTSSKHPPKEADKTGKKHYSTMTTPMHTLPKPKEPCKNPYTGKKPCDFERTARIQDEKRQRRPQTVPKPEPTSNQKFSSVTANEQSTIVHKIKSWLNSWRPEHETITITKSHINLQGRETYTIEIQEPQCESTLNATTASSNKMAAAMTHDLPNAKVVMSTDADKPKKKKGGCPPSKTKKEEDKTGDQTDNQTDGKPKCRQRKKRKLPSCGDIGKVDEKKAMPGNVVRVVGGKLNVNKCGFMNTDYKNQGLNQIEQILDAAKPTIENSNDASQNVSFRLKPQFWRN